MLEFKYTTDAERVQACHEREERLTRLSDNIDLIVGKHEKIQKFYLLSAQDYNVLGNVLDWVILDILHQQAETEYIRKAFGIRGDDETGPTKSNQQ